jgi:succinate dehydrogenase hydrophobic anchor subunit
MHAFVGLWTIGTDYLTKRTLGFISSSLSVYANFIRKSFEFFFVFLGFFLVVFYLLIIWS